MLLLGFFYITFALGAVIALTLMILRIGALVGDCPVSQARTRAVSITVATGFAAFGAGGVIMIGAVLPVLEDAPFAALMLALGFAALCLGLGFTHAMGTLRAALLPAQHEPEPDMG
ncbi:hypothetical protein [uncultured Tateyamaria sp.]|uniref:hypothetical protein n=1 Tax=Tateyamaria sp. 1078 TaxID=3417464 RepID=UPI00261BFEBD|nr:hypothetical protein [uncultured Tateyamaria sp.]